MGIGRQRDGWLLVEQIPATTKHRVLCLPGLMGSDVVFRSFLRQPALAAAGIHVIAGNPPGYKGLPVPDGFSPTIVGYAELVEALAAAEGIDLVVGHSYGANVLIEMAARGRYRGQLALISPSLDRRSEAKDLATLDSFSRNPLLRGPIWWLTYLMMASVFKPYFTDPALLKDVAADAKRIPRALGRAGLVGFFDHLDEHGEIATRLAATPSPVRYLRGDRDDIAFTAAHREILARNPLISVHEIPDAGHFAMCDQPAAVAAHVVAMLA